MLRKMRPRDAIEENLFQCVGLAAHYRFYFICRKESSWLKACSIEREMMALEWAMEFFDSIFFSRLR